MVVIIFKYDCFVSEESKPNLESGGWTTDYSTTICLNLVSSLHPLPRLIPEVFVVNVVSFISRSGEDHICQENHLGLSCLCTQVKGFPHWETQFKVGK